jgi:glycosyltransferase involved in cell wall biosynthesis
MRIAFVQKNFHPNSIGMLNGLLDCGHDVINIVHYNDSTKSGSSASSVRTTIIGFGRLSVMLLSSRKKRLDVLGFPRVRELFLALQQFRPDVVVVKDLRTTSLVAAAIAKSFGATPVLMWNKPRTARKARLLAAGGGVLLPRRKFHTGYSGTLGEDMRLGGALGRSRLLPYPIRPGRPRTVQPEAGDRARPVRIVAVGSLTNPVKRFPLLIDAFALSGLGGRATLTIFGLGSEASPAFGEVRERERAHGLRPTEFAFNVPYATLQEQLRDFDLLVVPSQKEMSGAVIYEGMAQSLPVICSTRCGARVYLEDGISGSIFISDSVESLSERIRELVDDHDLRLRMGQAAYQRVLDHFTPEVWAMRFERLVTDGSPRRSTRSPDDAQRVMSSGEPPG